jgi:hypothetical protein
MNRAARVPLACHQQRSVAVRHGHSRTIVWPGERPITSQGRRFCKQGIRLPRLVHKIAGPLAGH